MTKKFFVGGNWKMNGSSNKVAESALELKSLAFDSSKVPFPYLALAVSAFKDSAVSVSAQNIHDKPSGAYTGEEVCSKTLAAINANIQVIFCLGESLQVREEEKTWDFVSNQLVHLFDTIKTLKEPENVIKNIVIAYEPIWAIGTGKVATPDQAQEVHSLIRSALKEEFGDVCADSVRIIYGELASKPDIDGFLVGGASLTSDFSKIIQAGSEHN